MSVLNPDKFPIVLADEATRATYCFRVLDHTPVAGATDVLTLRGSATKRVKVTRIKVIGTATAASQLDLYITKRTAANTGGTSTAPTISPRDSNNPTATAAGALYSANPTALGTGVGIEGTILFLAASGTPTGPSQEFELLFGQDNTQSLVLNGIAQSVAINFNAQTQPAGAKFYYMIEWVEEDL